MGTYAAKKRKRNGSSGYVGIYPDGRRDNGKWRLQATIGKKTQFSARLPTSMKLQFSRLFTGQGSIRNMTTEDLEFPRHNLCLRCDED